jgi:HAD domain in Swiss Army Knife RNA repair proteins
VVECIVMPRRLIALDVDGVLNRLDAGRPPEGWHDTVVTLASGRRLTVRTRFDYGDRLTKLALETEAQLVWLTTWEEEANTLIAPLAGLMRLPVIPLEPGREGMRFSENRPPGVIKARSLAAYLDEGDVCVWLDDDCTEADVAGLAGVKLVQVCDRYGLDDHDLDEAREFLLWHLGR